MVAVTVTPCAARCSATSLPMSWPQSSFLHDGDGFVALIHRHLGADHRLHVRRGEGAEPQAVGLAFLGQRRERARRRAAGKLRDARRHRDRGQDRHGNAARHRADQHLNAVQIDQRLGRVDADLGVDLGVAQDHLDLAALDAARLVHLVDDELRRFGDGLAPVDRGGQHRADLRRAVLREGRAGQRRGGQRQRQRKAPGASEGLVCHCHAPCCRGFTGCPDCDSTSRSGRRPWGRQSSMATMIDPIRMYWIEPV